MGTSTAEMLYPGRRLVLSADGSIPISYVEPDSSCCIEHPCDISPCDIACSFLDLLPQGPMWDRQKMEVKQLVFDTECDVNAVLEASCPSMALYGVYAARLLQEAVQTIIWPYLRESSPYTAVTTIDDWLAQTGYEDCYRSACRTLYMSELSPYERQGPCGSEYCPTDFSEEFEFALKHAILQSVYRANKGVIRNLDGINWVLEPLRSKIAPLIPYPPEVQEFLFTQDEECESCFCDIAEFEICPTAATIPGGPSTECNELLPDVPMEQSYTCDDEEPVLLYPAAVAAECIARTLLPRQCPNIVFRCGNTDRFLT